MTIKIITGLIFTSCVLFFKGVQAQILSGKILDKSGAPIENALVSQTNNPFKYNKTDESGRFSIDGTQSTKLSVGALGYETKKNISLSTTSNISIQLEDDPLLSTDVLHISFDHVRPGEGYTEDELKDDFVVTHGKGFKGDAVGIDNASIDVNVSIDGGASLKIKYPKGVVGTGPSGVDSRLLLSNDIKDKTGFIGDDIYLSYWVKFNDGIDYKCGGKMPSLGGIFDNSQSGKTETWKGRIMWRKGGSINMYMELPHEQPNMSDNDRMMGSVVGSEGCVPSDLYTSYLTDGEWHNVELHYVMEKENQKGIFECWIDGGRGYKYLESDVFGFYKKGWDGLETLSANTLLISTFFGGSSEELYGPEKDEYAWFDEFRVSRNRINEFDKYGIGGVVTGNKTTAINNNLSLFPNPSNSGLFHLSEETPWTLYSVLGEHIMTGTDKKINLSNFEKGMYVLKAGDKTIKVVYN